MIASNDQTNLLEGGKGTGKNREPKITSSVGEKDECRLCSCCSWGVGIIDGACCLSVTV